MTIAILIRWLVFLHVLSAITFFLAHGTSVAMTFQVRKRRTSPASAPCLISLRQP